MSYWNYFDGKKDLIDYNGFFLPQRGQTLESGAINLSQYRQGVNNGFTNNR
jgi:hypothetical protein